LTEATTLGVGLSAARRNEGHPGAFRDLGGAVAAELLDLDLLNWA